MKDKKISKIKDIECESLPVFKRNNYFYGKLLTANDFKTEQEYFVNKQRLINRLIHGIGVVCGLKVVKKGDNEIRIAEGVALDCCGREIVLPEFKDIDLNKQKQLRLSEGEDRGVADVWIKYHSCGESLVPQVLEGSSCEEVCCYSTIRESYQIEIKKSVGINANAFILLNPNPVGVGQNVLCKIGIKQTPPTYNNRFENLEVTVTKPDGSTETIGPLNSNPCGITWIYYTPDQVGTYTFEFTYEGKNVREELIVQEEPVAGAPVDSPADGCLNELCLEWENFIYNPETSDFYLKSCPISVDEKGILLAKVTYERVNEGSTDSVIITSVDNLTRPDDTIKRRLVYSNDHLYNLIECLRRKMGESIENDFPQIKEISWPHNKEYTLEEIEEFLEELKRLEFSFTRDVEKDTINHKTLSLSLMQYRFKEDEGKYAEAIIKKIEVPFEFIEKGDNKIAFGLCIPENPDTKKHLMTTLSATLPAGTSVFPNTGLRVVVRLKGDFIYDKNGKCLDGNHLRGVLPTGNGCGGGLFESWFDWKLDVSQMNDVFNQVKKWTGSTSKYVAKEANMPESGVQIILDRFVMDNKLIKIGENYCHPLSSDGITIVYDTSFNYLEEQAKEMEKGLKEKGFSNIRIIASDVLTEDDKKGRDLILLRSKKIDETTKAKIAVPTTTNWSKSEGDIEVTKHEPTGSRVFVVGGKAKSFIAKALDKFSESQPKKALR